MSTRRILLGALAVGLLGAGAASLTAAEAAKPAEASAETLVMVVMDPLAKPLSCPCVQGYAQRDYDKLAEKLSKALGRPVRAVYNESLAKALESDTKGRADLVIGKHSVVKFDAERTKRKLEPVASLTNKAGGTEMTGLILVPKDDPAHSLADLEGYRIVFGPEECDEKYSAALALLEEHGVSRPEKLETSPACSDGACLILEEAKLDRRGAAVISSYAQPLLEGCGTVEKGALRIVGETAPVPFIEAFVNKELPDDLRKQIATALLKSTIDPLLRRALETREGFVALNDEALAAKKK
jgi:ABC-type phosphate/phosphonate transport system substrate-binding protein